jgi:hypothetical protein
VISCPTRAPYHAWSNFEFRDNQGKWHEVDLLVLGEQRLHLVELKHYAGRIEGDAYRWRRRGLTEDSPLLSTRRKAQRLAGELSTRASQVEWTIDRLASWRPKVPRRGRRAKGTP